MSTLKVLRVNRNDVVEMLREMGFLSASRWETDRLLKKLKYLPKMLEEESTAKDPSTESLRILLSHICQAVTEGCRLELEEIHIQERIPVHTNGKGSSPSHENGKEGEKQAMTETIELKKETVIIETSVPHEEVSKEEGSGGEVNGEGVISEVAAPAKKRSRKKAGEKKEGEAISPSAKMGTDALGSRVGTTRAKVNDQLCYDEWRSMRQIVEGMGLNPKEHTFYNHLNKLAEKKMIERSEKGYRLIRK